MVLRREYAVPYGGLGNLVFFDLCRVIEKFSVSIPFCKDVEFHSKSFFFLFFF